MVYTNITSEFRDLLREKEKLYPDAKRRKLARREPPRPAGIDKEYLREACTIVRTLCVPC